MLLSLLRLMTSISEACIDRITAVDIFLCEERPPAFNTRSTFRELFSKAYSYLARSWTSSSIPCWPRAASLELPILCRSVADYLVLGLWQLHVPLPGGAQTWPNLHFSRAIKGSNPPAIEHLMLCNWGTFASQKAVDTLVAPFVAETSWLGGLDPRLP